MTSASPWNRSSPNTATLFGGGRLCRILDIRRLGFYEWVAATPARAEQVAREDRLVRRDRQDPRCSPWRLGSLTGGGRLRRSGRVVNHKRVERIMRDRKIAGITRRRRRSSKTSRSPGARSDRP